MININDVVLQRFIDFLIKSLLVTYEQKLILFQFLRTNYYNLEEKVVDKFTKLNKSGSSMSENFPFSFHFFRNALKL